MEKKSVLASQKKVKLHILGCKSSGGWGSRLYCTLQQQQHKDMIPQQLLTWDYYRFYAMGPNTALNPGLCSDFFPSCTTRVPLLTLVSTPLVQVESEHICTFNLVKLLHTFTVNLKVL